MAENNSKWPTLEEFAALQALAKEGKAKPIADLIREKAPTIHYLIPDALEDLDNWQSSMRWLITQKPRASIKRRKKAGRPPNRERVPFYDKKIAELAVKIAQVHIETLDQLKRMPKKKELRDAVLADKDLAKEIGFGRKKRTAQDNMIAEAHDFLMSVSKKTVG